MLLKLEEKKVFNPLILPYHYNDLKTHFNKFLGLEEDRGHKEEGKGHYAS